MRLEPYLIFTKRPHRVIRAGIFRASETPSEVYRRRDMATSATTANPRDDSSASPNVLSEHIDTDLWVGRNDTVLCLNFPTFYTSERGPLPKLLQTAEQAVPKLEGVVQDNSSTIVWDGLLCSLEQFGQAPLSNVWKVGVVKTDP